MNYLRKVKKYNLIIVIFNLFKLSSIIIIFLKTSYLNKNKNLRETNEFMVKVKVDQI